MSGIQPSDLAVVTLLDGVPASEIAWLAEHCVERRFDADEVLFQASQVADVLMFLVEGVIEVLRREGGQEVATFTQLTGEIGGLLPFSRMDEFGVDFVGRRPGRLALLPKSNFSDLRQHAPQTEERLVHRMLDRTRDVTRFDLNREKLAALGTMSAGLAHELNNPASAARRTARDLADTLQAFDELSSKIVAPFIFRQSEGERDPFEPVYQQMTLTSPAQSPLEQSDLEDELADWLEEQGADEPWNAAATLVSGGFTRAFLADFSHRLVADQVTNFLNWVPKDVEMRLLARELVESTRRIAELVQAMKSYSYMDQGVGKAEVDLHHGLETTLRVLGHKLKQKKVQVVRQFDDQLPSIKGFGSELNQVWTNLIDNAVAAVAEGGTLTLATSQDSAAGVVCVEVIDDGEGIPKEIRDRIFEPFFTTRPVGEGTGLGLDISNRIITRHHQGNIQVESEPGHTCFRVRLPLG